MTYDFTTFPYVPGPEQNHFTPQGEECLPYTSAELDAWLGTSSATTHMSNVFDPTQVGSEQVLQDFGSITTMEDLSFGNALHSEGAPSVQGGPQQSQDLSPWSIGNDSSMNTALHMYNGALDTENRNPQRQVLLAAVDRLVQLASLIN